MGLAQTRVKEKKVNRVISKLNWAFDWVHTTISLIKGGFG